MEAQLAEATHARAAEEAKANVYKAEMEAHSKRERELLEQLSGYADKFGEVEKMLQDSNAVRPPSCGGVSRGGSEMFKSPYPA